MKRLIAFSISALLSLALLSGCTSADPNHPYDREPAPANQQEQDKKEETSAIPFSWQI